jgi:hypothetical protein
MSTPSTSEKPFEALIDALEKADFFACANPEDIPRLKEEMAENRWPFPFESGREFFADAEELSEQGVIAFLNELKPFLAKRGVTWSSLADEMDEDVAGYSILIDGGRYSMCSAQELNLPPWEKVSARAFALVDALLYQAGAEERMYCLYFGGNEQAAIFLTPRQYDIVKQWPMPVKDRPLSSVQMLQKIG